MYLDAIIKEDRVDCISLLLLPPPPPDELLTGQGRPIYWDGEPISDRHLECAATCVKSVAMVQELARFGIDLFVQTGPHSGDSIPYLRLYRSDLAQAFREAQKQYKTRYCRHTTSRHQIPPKGIPRRARRGDHV
jgi:hypothetical protein